MKKLLFIFLSSLLLSACGDKNAFEAAVLAEMQNEKDLKDYKIDPENMTSCVVDLTAKKMSGLFPVDPTRMTEYQRYTTMLTLTKSENPKETLAQLIKDFGSSKNMMAARMNYTESVGNCLSSIIMKSEDSEKEESDAKPAPLAENITKPVIEPPKVKETSKPKETTDAKDTTKPTEVVKPVTEK